MDSDLPPLDVPDPFIEKNFRRALEEQRKGGRENRAGTLYRGVLRRDPSHYGSWINLGVLEYERGKTEEAVRCFTRAQALRPEATEACFNLGKAMRTLGDRQGAQKYLELAYEASPGDGAVLEELGELYVATERLAAARALADDGRSRGLEGPVPAVLMARTCLAAARFDEAETLLEALLKEWPDCHQAFSVLAEVRHQKGDDERAVLTMKRALLIAPRSGSYHRQLGVYQGAVGDHDEAKASFARAGNLAPGLRLPQLKVQIETEPSAAWERLRLQSSLLERSRAYAQKGRFKAGIAEFLALTAKYPYEAVVWQELGWFYEKLDEPRRALTLYRRATELDPMNLEVKLRLGRIELLLGRPEATRELLDSLDVGVHDVPEVLELEAEYHRQIGEAETGRGFFEKALARMPNRISSLRGVGACLVAEGDLEGATEAWTKAFRAYPGDDELANSLADLLVQRGEADAAERILLAASERSPEVPGLHAKVARLRLEQRRFTAARKAYQTLTDQCSPTTAAEGLEMLEAQLFSRELKPAKRLLRSLARLRGKGVDAGRLALLESVHAVLQRDGNKFNPAWQRAWREDPQLDRHAKYLAGVFDAADMEFFQQEVRKCSSLFSRDAALAEGHHRLAEELTSGGALRSLPAPG